MNKILLKRNDESINAYIDRITELKQELDMTWDDVRDVANEQTGLNLGSDSYRKRCARKKNCISNISNSIAQCDNTHMVSNTYEAFRDTDTDEVVALKKERIKISDERIQNNAYIRCIAREETLRDIAHDFACIMNTRDKLTPTRVSKITTKSDKEALLCVSDWHYGIDISNVFNTYNPKVAKDRVQQLQEEVIKRCKERGVTKITVLNLGDLIAGNIHLPIRINSRMNVISQIMQVSELYGSLLVNLSEHFDVKTYSVLDNHSRIDPNKKEAIQLETLARITDWYLKERLKGFPIEICDNSFDEDIATFEILGHKIIGVHGDKDKQSKIINSLSTFTQQHYDLICSAHLHHFSATESNMTLLLSNGSLMSTDDYAFNLRLNSLPSQNLIIITKDNVCDELHRIILD